MPEEVIEQRHKDIACSLQYLYESAFFNLLNKIYEKYKIKELCIAGGCGANSVANGKITSKTPFESVYIHPSPGDSGGALGAALAIWNDLSNKRSPEMKNIYTGYESSNQEIKNAIEEIKNNGLLNFKVKDIQEDITNDNSDWLDAIVDEIIGGKVIGWFQGRQMGPGNRSIIGDPRRAEERNNELK